MKKNQSGQSLVLLLFFVLMAMTFAVSAILMMVIGSGSVSTLENGIEIRQVADSGVENALLKLVRDPGYTGETYLDGLVNVEIAITGGAAKTIMVTATQGDFTRRVTVLADYDHVLGLASWKEEF